MTTHKQIAAFLLAILLLVLPGCRQRPPEEPGITLKNDMTLAAVLKTVTEEIPLNQPEKIDDQVMEEIIGVDLSLIDEYAGELSLSPASADNLIIVKAKDGKAEEVQQQLQRRLDFVRAAFADYQPDQHEKALAGQVITKGEYICLIIVGRFEMPPAEEIDNAKEKILDCFND